MTDANDIRRLMTLMESQTKTATKTKNADDDFDWSVDSLMPDMDLKGQLATQDPKSQEKSVSTTKATSLGKKSNDFSAAAGNMDMDAAHDVMGKAMANMPDADPQDLDGDEHDWFAGVDEPKTPSQELAVQSQEIMGDDSAPQVNWHDLPSTPGYRMVIGAFGPLFRSLGMNPRDTKVCTTLTSGETDMKKMLAYIANNGVKDDKFSLEAFDIDPEQYHVSGALMYQLNDETFLVMQERLGSKQNYYIYSAPDQGHRNTKGVEKSADQARLG